MQYSNLKDSTAGNVTSYNVNVAGKKHGKKWNKASIIPYLTEQCKNSKSTGATIKGNKYSPKTKSYITICIVFK